MYVLITLSMHTYIVFALPPSIAKITVFNSFVELKLPQARSSGLKVIFSWDFWSSDCILVQILEDNEILFEFTACTLCSQYHHIIVCEIIRKHINILKLSYLKIDINALKLYETYQLIRPITF